MRDGSLLALGGMNQALVAVEDNAQADHLAAFRLNRCGRQGFVSRRALAKLAITGQRETIQHEEAHRIMPRQTAHKKGAVRAYNNREFLQRGFAIRFALQSGYESRIA
jgi:hypothetical protein